MSWGGCALHNLGTLPHAPPSLLTSTLHAKANHAVVSAYWVASAASLPPLTPSLPPLTPSLPPLTPSLPPLTPSLPFLPPAAKVKRMVVSTYQAASGAGQAAMEELEQQTREVLEGERRALLQRQAVAAKCGVVGSCCSGREVLDGECSFSQETAAKVAGCWLGHAGDMCVSCRRLRFSAGQRAVGCFGLVAARRGASLLPSNMCLPSLLPGG